MEELLEYAKKEYERKKKQKDDCKIHLREDEGYE